MTQSAAIRAVLGQVEHFQRRVVQDALAQASGAYWLRRADDFEAVKPRPGDFTGQAMLPELRDQWRRAHETAKACRNRAALALVEDWSEEICAVLGVEVDGEAVA